MSGYKETINEQYVDRETHCEAGGPVADYPARGLYRVDNKTSSGVNTPNFHKRKREGELLPFTPWVQTEESGLGIGSFDLNHENGTRCWGEDLGYYHLTRPSIPFYRSEIHQRLHTTRLVQSAAAGIY